MSSASDVELQGVVKRFDDAVAVDGVSVEIPSGSFFALLGPSGCGKTTTLRMIGGFEEPDEGAILLGGKDVVGLPPHKRDVNTVFQSYALFPHLTDLRERRLRAAPEGRRRGPREAPGRRDAGARRARPVSARRRPRQLSGGQQQRVALARALVNRPQVLLLDEPLGALDLKLRKQMQLELKAIQHDIGLTFVHVTHDQEEAMTMADVIAVMNRGRIEQLGSPTELYERPATAFVASFLGVSNLLRGTTTAPDRVRIEAGDELHVPLGGRTGEVAVGIRPEKIRLGPPREGENALSGTVKETAYVGVATQYIVATGAGDARRLRAEHRRADARSPPARWRCSAGAPSPPSSSTPKSLRRRHHESPTDPQAAARARRARRRSADASRLPGRLRRRRRRSGRRRDHAGGRGARRPAPLLELAALHRLRREDEEAPDAGPVHRGDRRRGRLLRGHQRQRVLLREDPAPALAGPVDRPRHHRPDGQLALPLAADRRRAGPRSSTSPRSRTSRTCSLAREPELRPRPRVQPPVAVRDDRDRDEHEADRRQAGADDRRSCSRTRR